MLAQPAPGWPLVVAGCCASLAVARMPKLSVIVVNWNGRHLLDDCLASLGRQTFRDFECILVDNGSTDGSQDLVREKYPALRLIGLSQNHGFAGGNNVGIAAAQGELVTLLNNDAAAEPNWLEELDRALRENPRFSFVASRVVLADRPDTLDSAGDGMATVGAAFKIGHLQPAALFDQPVEVFGASAAASCYRRSMLDEIGVFDERFFCIYEDADLSFRARLRGHRCLYWPKAVVRHKLNATLGTRNRQAVFWGQRNLELVYYKNMPAELRAKYRWSRRMFQLVSAAYFLARGRMGTYWKAKKAARKLIEGLPALPASDVAQQIGSLLEPRWLRTRLAGK